MSYSDLIWNLCLAAEKLVSEQASAKTDLEMAVCFSTFWNVFVLYGKCY
jgi:hypothetical protein